jgi:7,8-dihydro-6-hydroxymethylpterin-pyrophosphokinase
MVLRRFVLEPLQEIHASWKHPQTGISLEDLLIACEDSLIDKLPFSVSE